MKYAKSEKGYYVPKGIQQEVNPGMSGDMSGGMAGAGGPGDGKLMNTWNSYIDWLDQKGMKGSEDLDKGDLGFKMVEQFNAEMKKQDANFTPITRQDVGKVQGLLKDYREYAKQQVYNDKAKIRFGDGQELMYSQMNPQQKDEFENTYFSSITKTQIDEKPGQFTTRVKFPSAFVQEKDAQTGEKIGTRSRQGFATPTGIEQK